MEKSASKPTTCKNTRLKQVNLALFSHEMQINVLAFQKYLERKYYSCIFNIVKLFLFSSYRAI